MTASDWVYDQLREWDKEGKREFDTRDLFPVIFRAGLSRAWLQITLDAAASEDIVRKTGRGRWVITGRQQ